jgi:hypothetical protein
MARRRRRKLKFEIRLSGRSARIAGIAFGVLLLVATIGCVVYSSAGIDDPGDLPVHSAPEPLDKLDRIEGWVPYWGDEAKTAREAIDAGFTDLMFFHGSVDTEGAVSLEDPEGLKSGLTEAREGGVRSWLTVTSHGGTLEGALGEGRLDAHADSLLDAFADSACDHLDLDYEGMGYHQAAQLLKLVEIVKPRLPDGAQLALTLQPVDDNLRPEQRGIYRELISSRHVYTVRVMMYDYHWRNSLPGALYPMPAFERLVEHWADLAHKLTLALPLYGYDWARPEDTSIPTAEVITLRDVRDFAGRPGYKGAWMKRDAELALQYQRDGVTRMVAAPSLRAIHERVVHMLDHGIPGVSFWHLGCGKLAEAREACGREGEFNDPVPHGELKSWDDWLLPFKRRVCKVIRCEGTDTLKSIANRHGVSHSAMYRYNEHVTGTDCRGATIYIPTDN